jgi:hypothetical protein
VIVERALFVRDVLYFTAGFSTIPAAIWSTIERCISCHGVWLCGT